MDPDGSIYNPLDLEGMLNDKRAKPRYLRISLLESITNNFSDDLVLGRGGFAVVYQGLLQNGVVAVKKLTQKLDVHEERFREEVDCLMRVKHKNIVRFLGYCSDTQGKFWELNGKTVIAEERQRFLCFEYLPGSLDKYMKEQPREHEWTTCYQIIKGVCEGLHYLHDQKIVHRDLKPANILLDHDMVPKIADFGLSKRFDKDQTHAITSNLIGSPGYMAPEFFGGLITFKSDIYSLGIIIIEILSGNKGCPDTDNVLKSWRIKFETSTGDAQLELVRACIKIAKECTDYDPAKRPDTWRILERLREMESTFRSKKKKESTYGVFEMAYKTPYSVQGITSAVPMGPGSTSTVAQVQAQVQADMQALQAHVQALQAHVQAKLAAKREAVDRRMEARMAEFNAYMQTATSAPPPPPSLFASPPPSPSNVFSTPRQSAASNDPQGHGFDSPP